MSQKTSSKKVSIQMVLGVLGCLVLILSALYVFSSKLKAVLDENMYDTLNQVAQGQQSNFRAKIDGQMYVLNSVADYMARVSEDDDRKLEMVNAIMESTVRAGDFISLCIFGTDSRGYNHLADPLTCGDTVAMERALRGEATVTKGKTSNGLEAFAITVPIYKNGTVVGSLRGVIKLTSMKQSLGFADFGGDGYAVIVDTNGDIIMDARKEGDYQGKNLFALYQNVEFSGDIATEDIVKSMQSNKEGTLHYTINNTQKYITYKKLGINDWYLFSVVNHRQVASQSSEIMTSVYMLTGETLIGVAFLVMLMLLSNKRRVKELEESNKHVLAAQSLLDGVYKDMPGGMIVGTVEEFPKLKFVSMGTLEIFEYTEEEFTAEFGNNVRKIIYEKDRVESSAETDRQIEEENEVCVHHRIITKSGEIKWVHNLGKIVTDETGSKFYYCVLVDITDYKLAEIELRRSERKLNTISEQSSGVIFEIDLKKKRITHGDSFKKIFGRSAIMDNFPEEAVTGGSVHPDDVDKFMKLYRPFEDSDARHETLRLARASGDYLWCSITVSALFEDGEAYIAVGKITDVDEQTREKEDLRTKARRDSMTGLYNKMATQEKIMEAIHNSEENTNQVMMVIDLDDFKSINDSHGHLAGDMVLNELSQGLKNIFRRSDIIGRVGGDEFLVFLPYFYNKEDILKKVEEICKMFETHKCENSKDLKVSVSIGVAFTNGEKLDYEEIFRRADEALYDAKQQGKNCYAIYKGE